MKMKAARWLTTSAIASLALVATASATAAVTARVSTTGEGRQAGSSSSYPAASHTGRFVAFESDASDLAAADTNGVQDIFFKDVSNGTAARISTGSGGEQANGQSGNPAISADGRYVAFESYASNLVAGDYNGASDIFVKDIATGLTRRISTGPEKGNKPQEGNGDSHAPSISNSGRYVAYESYASNLVPGDTNGARDIFVADTDNRVSLRVNVTEAGLQTSHGDSYQAAISGDGEHVAFESDASDLVLGDTNSDRDIFVKDTGSGSLKRVNTSSDGRQSTGGYSHFPAISADGRYVAFESNAYNLVSSDTNETQDIFVKDTETNRTRRVSSSSGDSQSNGYSTFASVSSDGRSVAFASGASNLVTGDANGSLDVFVKDTDSGATRLVTTSGGSHPILANSSSFNPTISGDGDSVVFGSFASNLVVADTNETQDVFRVSFVEPTTPQSTVPKVPVIIYVRWPRELEDPRPWPYDATVVARRVQRKAFKRKFSAKRRASGRSLCRRGQRRCLQRRKTAAQKLGSESQKRSQSR